MAAEGSEKVLTWHGFTQESSMHGIRYIFMTDIALWRRIVWLLEILALLSYSLYATSIFLNDYSRKSVSTKIKVQDAPNLTFPTVTICNRNYWKYSAIQQIAGYTLGANLAEIAADLYTGSALPPPEDKYNWTDSHLKYLLGETFASDYDTFLEALSHSLNDTFRSCHMNAKEVACNEIFTTMRTDAGLCYSFNRNGSYYSHSAGKSGGLVVSLDAKADEYTFGPNSKSVGFLVSIHNADEVPLMEELAYAVSVGTETNFLIERKETERKPPPADGGQADCIDTTKIANTLLYHQTYSQSACIVECKTAFVISKCGCRDFLQIGQFSEEHEYLKSCHCKVTCNEVQYTARLSTSRFPSKAITRDPDLLEHMRDNYAVLNFAYGKMSYQHVEEHVMYNVHDFFANLGGIFGVCVGCSILTWIELLEFAILKLANIFWRNKDVSKKTTPVKAFVVDN